MRQVTNRIAYLDGLRGLAAALVVIHHLMIGFYPSTYTVDPATMHTGVEIERVLHNTPLGVGINGGLAVAIFLVLSGYVVGINADSFVPLIKVLQTGVKRFFRFFLPILATHIVAVTLLKLRWFWNLAAAELSGSDWWLGAMWRMEPSIIEAIKQAFLSLFKMYPLDQVYNSSTWTMPFFFLGPIFLMGILWLFKRAWVRGVVLAVLLGVYIKTHYWPIILGYFLSRMLKDGIKLPRVIQVGLGMLIIVLANYPQAYDTASESWLYSHLPVIYFSHTSTFYHTLATVMAITLIASSSKLQGILASRPLLFLGKISFSVYLLHILVINSVTSGVVVMLFGKLPYSGVIFVSQLVSWPLIIGGSICLFRFVEQPAATAAARVLQWGGWLSQGYNKKLNRK